MHAPSASLEHSAAAARPPLARPTPTDRERRVGEDELIVSKTDRNGRIVYCNRIFERLAGYSEDELLGAPHSIVRHPEMPRCVFKLLWDTIQSGREIFAYVVNLARNGDHYWVIAHVTPSFDRAGNVIGYHSNRRAPERGAVEAASALYKRLLAAEGAHSNARDASAAGSKLLAAILGEAGMTYDQWVFSISRSQS
jgi:PAS domain S-box-containing protein